MSKQPGILLMVRELHHGGSERQLSEIALGLMGSSYQPHVGAFRLEGIRVEALRAAGVPILHLPVQSFKSPAVLGSARQFARYVREQNIRLVHTFDMPLTAAAIPATRMFTNAVALASQRCHLSLAGPQMRRFLLFAERIAHGVVVNCEYLERHLVEDAGIVREHVHLCYNGVDLERFRRASAPRPAALPDDALVIGAVGVLRPEKGHKTLLDAFARMRTSAANVRLLILGSGPMLPELQSRARELGIFDACIFEPSTDRVDEWLQHIDIFVLPSVSEALSNALMEAMACGCCCIASRVGGNPELIEDGARGLLFEPGNSSELEGKLREAVADQELRARLAEGAHDFIHARFSREASVRQMTSIYDKLLAGRL